MSREFTTAELEAYLDEALTPEEMAGIERVLRKRPELLRQLSAIHSRRDAGVHTLGEIWRRHRISCPTRSHLGSYLLGALSAEHADYIKFHLEKAGCRFCQANLEDLRREQSESNEAVVSRRSRYFQSSAGYLRGDR